MSMESSQTWMSPGVITWPSVVEFFIKMICFMKTFDLNWVLTLTTTKYIFRVRRLTTSSAVVRRMRIQLVAGINPTTSRVIHRNIKHWLCQEPSRKSRKRCTSMAIQFGGLKRSNYWGWYSGCKPTVLGTYWAKLHQNKQKNWRVI